MTIASVFQHLFASYYECIRRALINAPMFFVGMMFGYWSYKKINLEFEHLLLVGVIFLLVPTRLFSTLIMIFVISWVIEKYVNKLSVLTKVLVWFGNHSLEIYVFHLILFAFLTILFSNMGIEVSKQVIFILTVIMTLLLSPYLKRLFNLVKLPIR